MQYRKTKTNKPKEISSIITWNRQFETRKIRKSKTSPKNEKKEITALIMFSI